MAQGGSSFSAAAFRPFLPPGGLLRHPVSCASKRAAWRPGRPACPRGLLEKSGCFKGLDRAPAERRKGAVRSSLPRESQVTQERTLVGGIAGRYAIALFELAKEAKALDAVEADLAALRRMIGDSADLARLVRSPVFARDDQARAMAAILDKTGAHELTRKFIGLVARNRRLFALPDMAHAFSRLLAEARGEESALVLSARPLTRAQVTKLAERLSASLGKEVRLETEVDEDLIGGLVVQVGSRLIDTSLRTKLANIQLVMREAG